MRLLPLLLLFLFVVGCTNGPAEEQLKGQVSKLINQKFGSELFAVESFSRRGSHQHGQGRVTIYFKLGLKLLKPVKFGEWNKLGVNTLIATLGAATSGIKGVRAEGNAAGDILTIYGSSKYSSSDSEWRFEATPSAKLTSQGKVGVVNDLEAENNVEFSKLSANQRYLQILENNMRRLNTAGKKAVGASLKETVLNSIVWAEADKHAHSVATGEKGGEYYHFAKSFENVSDEVAAFESLGSGHNIRLVSSGAVKFGIVQSDMMKREELAEYTKNVDSVMALFPEAVHVIVMAKSNVEKFVDLKGKSVSIGTKLSGSSMNAKQLVRSHGMEPNDLKLVYAGLSDSLEELASGKIDAMIFTGSFPMAALNAFTKKYEIRFVELQQEKLIQLSSNILLTIPRKTYTGQNADYKTFGTTAALIARNSTTREEVKDLLSRLFKSQKSMIKMAPKALNLDRGNWKTGVVGSIHPGAESYFLDR